MSDEAVSWSPRLPYHFKFHYYPQDAYGQVVTTVNVSDSDGAITQGHAVCQPSDRFVKEVGRRIAITRAIEAFPREVRAKIWASYWASKGPLKASREA